MNLRAVSWIYSSVCVGVFVGGCGSPVDTSGSTGGATTSTSTTSVTGGTGGTMVTGGTAGDGGTGGSTMCEPGTSVPCYEGLAGTEGVGACKAGLKLCKANGSGYGECTGQVLPAEETCETAVDDNCNGQVNESGTGCSCVPGASIDCYSGPVGTENVGDCVGGTQVCNDQGNGYGPCTGEVVPQPETCATPGDEDCDGLANEDGLDCSCVPGTVSACYSGPPGTLDVGACKAGTHTCKPDGAGYTPCEGEIIPVVETCDTPIDDNCNGAVNEEGVGCACVPNTMSPCYTGPAGTADVGACKSGSAMCKADGTGLGPCIGSVLPVSETCATPVDDDCDGMVNEEGPGCACVPGTMTSCYTGPAGTLNNGPCKGGMATCGADGQPGTCVGQVLPSEENCATAEQEDCATSLDCGGTWWAYGYGVAGQQQAFRVVVDGSGASFLVGSFSVSLQLDPMNNLMSAGGSDIFVARFDPNGILLWAKRFGSAGTFEQASSAAIDSAGNVVVTGYFDGSVNFGGATLTSAGGLDMFVAKLDKNGNHMWSNRYGSTAQQFGVDVAVDPMDNVLLLAKGFNTMDFGGGVLTSAGSTDVFVTKLTSAGSHLWSKRFGNAGDDDAVSIGSDMAGDVIFGGSLNGAADFGGGVLTSAGGSDAYAVKLDPSGGHLWSKRYGDGANQAMSGVAIDGNGNVLLTGGFEGSINFGGGALNSQSGYDLFVAKLDPSGNTTFAKRYGAAGVTIESYSVAAGPLGEVVFAGPVTGNIDFGGGVLSAGGNADAFIVRLDSSGNHLWSKRHGAALNQYPRHVAVHSSGDVFVAGYFEGSMDVGPFMLQSAGASDVWHARLAR